MKNGFLTALRQGWGLRAVLAVAAEVLLIVVASMDTLLSQAGSFYNLPYGYHTNLVLDALHSDTMAPFFAIAPVLPMAASYLDDVKSKFARFYLIRTGYPVYLVGRLLACFLWGGGVLLLGTVLAWWGAALAFLPVERAAQGPLEVTEELLKTCGLLFLNGGLWAIVGLAMSTLMESKYIAYCAPFVVYYLLVILCERYFPECFLLYPREWTNPSDLWPFGIWGPAVVVLELSILFALVFAFRAERRLREL